MWIEYKTIAIKEFLRFIRIWVQTIFPPVIITSLYLLIFGNLIGDRIGNMEGLRYIEYIIPGVIIMTVITNSYANVVSSFFLAKFNHSIEEILVSPTPYWIILLGYISGGIARGSIVGIVVFTTTTFFVDFAIYNIFISLVIFILTSILFSMIGLINAIFAKNFDDISIIPTFVLTPMTYLGGMFYSINILPEFWKMVSQFNPIYYIVDGFRFGMYGVSSSNIIISIMILVFSAIVLFILIIFLMKKVDNRL